MLLSLIFPKTHITDNNFLDYLNTSQIKQQNLFWEVLTKEQSQVFESVLVCSEYKKAIKDLIYRCKFGMERAISKSLARLVVTTLKKKELASKAFNSFDFITFVPADPLRIKHRGFHLPEIISNCVAKELSANCINSMSKTKHTRAQSELDKKERQKNLQQVFKVYPGFWEGLDPKIKTKNKLKILVIDDVYSTGSTLYNSFKPLKQFFGSKNIEAKIFGLTIAGNSGLDL